MSGIPSYSVNTDKRVRLLKDGTPVSPSTAQSQYARPLNLTGTGVTATPNDTLGTFDVNIPGATPTTYSMGNVGTGIGTIYRDTTTNTFNIKTLIAGTNVTITNNANDITINSTATGGSSGGGTLNPNTNNRAWGTFIGGGWGNATATPWIQIGSGLFSGYLAVNEFDSSADANGSFSRFITTSTSGSQSYYSAPANKSGGTVINTSSLTLNPNFWIKVKYPDVTNLKTFIGFYDTWPPNTNGNFLNSQNGFGLLYNAATNSTWQIENNNNGTTNVVTDTGIAMSNNTIYKINIVGDSANTRWGVSINGSAMTYITTTIPTGTNGIGFLAHITTSTGSTRSMDTYYIYGEQNA